MDLIETARKRFNQFVADLNCRLNGHTQKAIIEHYPRVTRAKNWGNGPIKTLVSKKPYFEEIFVTKCACRSCGRIFLEQRRVHAGPLYDAP